MSTDRTARLETIARFDLASLAEVAAGRLREADIPCHITTGQIPGMPRFYGSGEGTVRLQVPRSFVEEARAILEPDP